MNYMKSPDKQALSESIEMEEKGYSFYKDTAGKTADPLARQIFDFLAAEELHHIEAIKEFYNNYNAGKAQNVDQFIKSIGSLKSKAITNLFKTLAEGVPIAGGELDAYKFGIDFERKGEAFYKKAEAEVLDADAKRLYSFLVGEERRHAKILESCLLYFENPAEFFHQREQWAVDGV